MTTITLAGVAVLLAVALGAARRAARRQSRLERDNDVLKRELARHREIAHAILTELQNT